MAKPCVAERNNISSIATKENMEREKSRTSDTEKEISL